MMTQGSRLKTEGSGGRRGAGLLISSELRARWRQDDGAGLEVQDDAGRGVQDARPRTHSSRHQRSAIDSSRRKTQGSRGKTKGARRRTQDQGRKQDARREEPHAPRRTMLLEDNSKRGDTRVAPPTSCSCRAGRASLRTPAPSIISTFCFLHRAPSSYRLTRSRALSAGSDAFALLFGQLPCPPDSPDCGSSPRERRLRE